LQLYLNGGLHCKKASIIPQQIVLDSSLI